MQIILEANNPQYFLDRAGELLRESRELLDVRHGISMSPIMLETEKDSENFQQMSKDAGEIKLRIQAKTSMALSLIAITKAILDESEEKSSGRKKRKKATPPVQPNGSSGEVRPQ